MDGAVTQMCYAGDLLVSERTGSEKTLWYRYDSSGNVIALTYESEIYMYLRNAQNDIIGLLDKDGKAVVRYTYDSWGQVVKIEGTLKDKVGARNPFRYKGYYYDVETGLYYCRSRYYDPAIRRFISADDTQVLRDNLDMLGEKNLYTYCDDNPITRVDGDGQCWNIVVGAVIGAAVNVITGGIAATVTGQKYSGVDIFWAAVAGAGGDGGMVRALIGGGISAVYTICCSYQRGDSLLKTVLNASTAFLATVFISNVTGFASIPEHSQNLITGVWGTTFGLSGNLTAAGVSAGISMSNTSENKVINQPISASHISVPIPKKAIGQSRTFNGKNKVYSTSFIYKASNGKVVYKKRKNYYPRNARTV